VLVAQQPLDPKVEQKIKASEKRLKIGSAG
jgi:hypothetical protein